MSVSPITITNAWIEQEVEKGSSAPQRATLSTASMHGLQAVPHSRIVALREVTEEGLLFFTSTKTRKYVELKENPNASMVIWLAQQQRQVVVEGKTVELSEDERLYYWQALTKERQLKISSYIPHSSDKVSSEVDLEKNYQRLSEEYEHKASLPLSEFYVGFRLIPNKFHFYTLPEEGFSQVQEYTLDTTNPSQWLKADINPC